MGVDITVVKGIYPHKRGYFGDPDMPAARKANPINVEYETKAKNLLKGELKRRGVTYAELARRLGEMGIQETEKNLNNKISRGGFTAAFLLQCLDAIRVSDLRL